MTYKKLPGITPDGVVYENELLGTLEALVTPGHYSTAHAPALLELPNGDMLCAWFAGSFEGSTDISIVCARLPKGADRWEKPVQVSHDHTRSEQNPSLFLLPSGEIWVMYTAQIARTPGKPNMQFTSFIRRQRSLDNGKTWGEPDVMFPREGSFCRQPIQVLSNGRWIFTHWFCLDDDSSNGSDYTAFQLSDDQGKTWRLVEMPQSAGCVHANVVELENGRLAAFMRTRMADFIYRSESSDWGETWSAPVPTTLPNNNASISAVKLKSGRIAITYNPTSSIYKVEQGVSVWPGLRSPVAVALSEDGGLSWPLIRLMDMGEGFVGPENRSNNRQYEYPFIMQSSDERIHLAFAYHDRIGIKYMSFTEADVAGKKRETEGLYNPTAAQTH
ncbi:sialidase family protein [Oscillospiraceae bacterium MB08-C2-2]|nr:sialidase family protein [Oscillospiraceae bacterium MB08-C2-2]